MSTQPTRDGMARIAFERPEMRASDADRESVVRLLNDAFTEGRLSADEHEHRVSAAYAARSWEHLRQLTADLPAPESAGAGRRPAVFAGADLCLLCMLLIVCPPAGIAWWLLSRRRLPVPPPREVRVDGEPPLPVGGEHAKNR